MSLPGSDSDMRYVTELRQQRDELATLLRVARGHNCDHMHHGYKDRHASGQPCPVLARIDAALTRLEKTP